MLPAHQCLDMMLGPIAKRNLRLVKKRQFVGVNRLAQIAHQRQPFAAVLIIAIVPHEHAQIVSFRGVHCDVGVADKRRTFAAMLGEHGDADARANVDLMPVEIHRRFQRAQDRIGDTLRVARVIA